MDMGVLQLYRAILKKLPHYPSKNRWLLLEATKTGK